jgi:Fe2+ or Zn2+ uptake regulation protein
MENPTAELAAMERRWNERIANQKAVINRLMANRQRVLDLLQNAGGYVSAEALSADIERALNYE